MEVEEQEQQYQHIPEENYQNMTTGLFINFVQNYRLFLLDYINNEITSSFCFFSFEHLRHHFQSNY